MAVSIDPKAVIITMWGAFGIALTSRMRSKPSTSGMRRSVMTRSNGSARTRSTPARPFSAGVTTNPASLSSSTRSSRMASSSSTTRRRGPVGRAWLRSLAAFIDGFSLSAFRRGGEADPERGAGAAGAGVHLDPAVVLLDDAVRHRQAEAGSAAPLLGGVERLEDLVARLQRDAAAGVGHLDDHDRL